MQDLKSEEQGSSSNGTALFLVALFIAIGGVGGYFISAHKQPDAKETFGKCYNICYGNTSMLIKELNKKNYLKYELAIRLLEGFAAKCELDCKGETKAE